MDLSKLNKLELEMFSLMGSGFSLVEISEKIGWTFIDIQRIQTELQNKLGLTDSYELLEEAQIYFNQNFHKMY